MPLFVSPSGRQYKQCRVLGTGVFGTIIVCKDTQRETDCILKRVRLARQTAQERFASVQEMALLQQLKHRNLIQGIDGWLENKHTTCLVMESCQGGDLASLLESRHGTKIDEEDVKMMIVQLAAVVSYLHSVDILHRDIKSSNIFIGDRQQLKLADLGLCRQLSDSSERPRTSAGTLNYMSPELTKEESYSKPADIWALGCVLYEVCSLKPAFHSFNCDGIMKKIKSGKVPAMPAEYSQPLRQLVRSMMYTDESKRPTAEEILNMPFLQDARCTVDELFGSTAAASEGSQGPAFRKEDIPTEWKSLMNKFYEEHKAHGKAVYVQDALEMRRTKTSRNADKPWRTKPAPRATDDGNTIASLSGCSSCDTVADGAAARGGSTCSVHLVGGSDAMDAIEAPHNSELTCLRPSDGHALTDAVSSVSACDRPGLTQGSGVPGGVATPAELLGDVAMTGSVSLQQASCEASVTDTSHSFTGKSGRANAQRKVGAVSGVPCSKLASGTQVSRASDRISAVNRPLSGRITQESEAAVTSRSTKAHMYVSTGRPAPGQLKHSHKATKSSAARAVVFSPHTKQTADRAVRGSLKHS